MQVLRDFTDVKTVLVKASRFQFIFHHCRVHTEIQLDFVCEYVAVKAHIRLLRIKPKLEVKRRYISKFLRYIVMCRLNLGT